MSYLELKNIRIEKDGKTILDGVDMKFEKGRIYAIVGPNGGGKTTLAGVIMGLSAYKDFSGDILFEGKNINKLDVKERADLGITLGWQDSAKFEGLSVNQYLQASSGYRSLELIKESLRKVGLLPEEYLDRVVNGSLSGGERKRVELASILAMDPKLVILDEPDSGIDISSIELILDSIQSMKEEGITVILITHSSDILDISDYAFLLCHGSIVDEGDVPKISQYFENKCLSCVEKNPDKVKNEKH